MDDIKHMFKFPQLKIGNLIAEVPVVQGGMGVGISMSGLASAVANEGGIGVISGVGLGMEEPDFRKNFVESNLRILSQEIRKARELSKGLIGVNFLGAINEYAEMVREAVKEKIDIIFSGAGLPLKLPQYAEGSDTKLVPIVSSERAADLICKAWDRRFKRVPDAFVVEGPKAGGHLGFSAKELEHPERFRLEDIIIKVIETVKAWANKYKQEIPVIAAGGIYSGEDIVKFLKLGAAGVQMGTRFVCTEECDASNDFKQAFIDSKKEDIGVINSPVGLPGRAIINDFLKRANSGERIAVKCPYHCLRTCDPDTTPYCITLALTNAKKGRMKSGFAFAGENAWRNNEIITVKELFNRFKSEAALAQ
ncbi:hypothetical protein LCGC14_1449660 [marine sediment metagenome]|uniref:Uncharacterized protein n=1 Tax=marine sediment metagenome TaxID=412755 RepID=A0A0F9K4I3_9ZZZZ